MSRTVRRSGAIALALLVGTSPLSRASSVELHQDMQWGLSRIHAPDSWGRARGSGVAVAIIDTGVDLLHEDLRDRVVSGHDFIDGDDQPNDENGHGTHVAGIAAATQNGLGVAGVAPGAVLLPMRVLDATGTGVESDVASAIEASVLRAAGLGMRLVVNMSFTDVTVTGGATSERIQDAVRRAWFAGAVIVAAVGNESLPFSDFPAAGPNVIAVGSIDQDERRSSFSNLGPSVVAPGEKIVSTFWDKATPVDHGVYASGTGTSMAAPFVSGVAALLLSAGMTNAQAVRAIHETADDLGEPGPDREFGYGVVNASRALGLPEVASSARPVIPGVASSHGKFEEVSAPSRVRAAERRDAPGPGKAVPGTVATVLFVGAYLLTRALAFSELRKQAIWER